MSSHSALLVIDMQRGVLEDGYPLFCGEEARRIIPSVKRLVEQSLDRRVPIFFSADAHASDDREFRIFPPHCTKGNNRGGDCPRA